MEENKKISLLNKEAIINDVVKGHILDINELGVLIDARAEFLPGSILDLSLVLTGQPIKAVGAIKQIKQGVVEIELLNLTPGDISYIREFLNSSSASEVRESSVRKILLVEDSRQLRVTYRDRLLEEGFAVTEGQSGTEAFVRLQEMRFDLVILDLGIEGIDGFKVLHIVRSNPLSKDIPVIILSARSSSADIEKAKALGATEYLVKTTTSPEILAAKVKEIFSQGAS